MKRCDKFSSHVIYLFQKVTTYMYVNQTQTSCCYSGNIINCIWFPIHNRNLTRVILCLARYPAFNEKLMKQMIEVVSRQIESLYFYVCAVLISTPEWHKQGETEPMAPSVMCLEWTLAPGPGSGVAGARRLRGRRNCFHNFKTSLRNTHPLRGSIYYIFIVCRAFAFLF